MPRESVTLETTKDPGTFVSRGIEVLASRNGSTIQYLLGTGINDEPITTEVDWSIQISRNDDGPWETMVHSVVTGLDGEVPIKPISMKVSIDMLIGLFVRTLAVTNARFNFGVDIEVQG